MSKGMEVSHSLSPKSGPGCLFPNLLHEPQHPKMTSGMNSNIKVKFETKKRQKWQRRKELRPKDSLGKSHGWSVGKRRKDQEEKKRSEALEENEDNYSIGPNGREIANKSALSILCWFQWLGEYRDRVIYQKIAKSFKPFILKFIIHI